MNHSQEKFVSVDVETAGPIPGKYSLLSIGACVVYDTEITFACELKPINFNFSPKALEVTGLSLDDLSRTGVDPATAIRRFGEWVSGLVNIDETPVFVGFNAPFDWSFVNYYFHEFLGQNPFGFAALDIKAYYMGATRGLWKDTRSSSMAEKLKPQRMGNHRALDDALYQAELFRLIRDRNQQS